MENKLKIFNSPIEVGIRALLILAEFSPKKLDLKDLVYLDYFLVHSSDVGEGPKSIHPPSPFRSGEIAVKREILKKSLQILHKKSLVEAELSSDGIKYKITETGVTFSTSQNTSYAQLLKERAVWVKETFGTLSQSDLDKYVTDNIQSWGAEFLNRG